jgi:hypothetical protein
MFNPSAAPRWNNTTNCFLPVVAGVAATARCKNAGMALNPTIAIPPCFKKYRRENLIGRTPSQHRSLIACSLGVGQIASTVPIIYPAEMEHSGAVPLQIHRDFDPRACSIRSAKRQAIS